MKRRPRNLLKVQSLEKALLRLVAYLSLIFALHIGAMMMFEDMSFKDGWWLTVTSITTVGYGDLSAASWPGRLSTTLFIYIGGIFVLADFVNKVSSYNAAKSERKLKGTWRWKLSNHIVIIGTPDSHPDQFFRRLVAQIRLTPDFEHKHIQLLTQSFPDGLPEDLRSQGVVHTHGLGLTDEELHKVAIAHAHHVVIIANVDTDPASDAASLDILSRLPDVGFLGTSVVECVNDANRGRAQRFGANSIIRPSRSYPEMIVRALVSPGSEKVLEDLFDSRGSEVCRVELQGIINMPWREVVTRVVSAGAGIPVGYLDGDVIKTNPPITQTVHSSVLFVIMDSQTSTACDEVSWALADDEDQQAA